MWLILYSIALVQVINSHNNPKKLKDFLHYTVNREAQQSPMAHPTSASWYMSVSWEPQAGLLHSKLMLFPQISDGAQGARGVD